MKDKKFSPGIWSGHRMVNDKGVQPTAEELGEYVKNSVIKSMGESGSLDYFFVSVDTDDGARDVCHTGNGPTSAYNTALISAAPELLEALAALLSNHCDIVNDRGSWDVEKEHDVITARAAIAKATPPPSASHAETQ